MLLKGVTSHCTLMVELTSLVIFKKHAGEQINTWYKECFRKNTYKYKRVGIGKLVLDNLDNSQDASTDLFRSVTVIVSSYPQHYDLQQQTTKQCMTEHMSLIFWPNVPGSGILTQSWAQSVFCVNKQAWSCYLFLALFWTFGLMLSSSPLLSRHSTCCVASPPTPKLRQWRGENNWRHICRQTTIILHSHVPQQVFTLWKHLWENVNQLHNGQRHTYQCNLCFTPNSCMSWTRESPTNRTSGSLSLLSDTNRLCYKKKM